MNNRRCNGNERKDIEGLLISVDFENTFYSLEICYLIKVLQIFNFGPQFIGLSHFITLFHLAL